MSQDLDNKPLPREIQTDNTRTLPNLDSEALSRYAATDEYFNNPSEQVTPGVTVSLEQIDQTLSEHQKTSLHEYGFTLVQNALAAEQVEQIKESLKRIAAREGARANEEHHYEEEGVDRLANLVVKDPTFEALALDPRVMAAAQHVMQDGGVKLFLMNCRSPHATPSRQEWHIDGNHQLNADPSKPECFTAIWYLEDSTPENGGTIVLPGSHKLGFAPEWGVKHKLEGEIQIQAQAGDLFVMNAHTWHAGGHNPTGQHVPRILAHYMADWVKWDPTDGIDKPSEQHFALSNEGEKLVRFKTAQG